MNKEDMNFLKYARKLDDDQRFHKFIEMFPRTSSNEARAVRLLSHCSWRKKYQIKLFEYYSIMFHGDQIGFLIKCFSKIMSIKLLAKLVWNLTERNEKDRYFAKIHFGINKFNFNEEYIYFSLWKNWGAEEYMERLDRANI